MKIFPLVVLFYFLHAIAVSPATYALQLITVDLICLEFLHSQQENTWLILPKSILFLPFIYVC